MSSDHKKRKLAAESPNGSPSASFSDGEVLLSHDSGATFKVPGLIARDHIFKVPLDHSGESGGEINLFVREITSPVAKPHNPYLIYLQGGPGFESPRPCEASGWIKTAVSQYNVVLMDQRGTGRSSPITTINLHKRGSAEEQAKYLSFFRADSIVRDAEIVRKSLVPKENHYGRWALLGQSFGGFCCLTYLSVAPDSLIEVLMTGGIPPGISDACSADSVYKALFSRVIWQNKKYYTRYPNDVAVVQRIVRHLAAAPGGGERLPSGTLLTPRAFQLLGLSGLGSGGGFERLHYLLESFFDDDDEMTPGFAKSFESWMSWDTNPLYALLHEAIYCQGAASNWSAQRIRDSHFRKEFDAVDAARQGRPVFFTGEMVFPWMFDDFAGLRPYKDTANKLAAHRSWPALYSAQVLSSNKVPVVALSYVEDMYVDLNLAQATAGQVRNMRQWITNEYKHSGLRDDGGRIFDRLLAMVRDSILPE